MASLSLIEVEVDRFQGNILRATGVANTYLVRTAEGNLLFDTGLATQAAKHKRLLQEAAPGPVTHIVLSHSHADHIGGVKFWRAECSPTCWWRTAPRIPSRSAECGSRPCRRRARRAKTT